MEKTRQNWTLSQHAQWLPQQLQSFNNSDATELTFDVEYSLEQHWRTPSTTAEVCATFRFTKDNTGTRITALMAGGVKFDLSKPVKCLPVTIPKQWGEEIWYSGIEARGESQVEGESDGGTCNLATYLSLAPGLLHGNLPITLIKVLDPAKGNLYLEVHQEKQEVYVVSHIDNDLWPEGTGGIRLGINQETRNKVANDTKLRANFLACAKAYESLRRKIDGDIDIDSGELESIENQLASFTQLKALGPGDVVKIPTWVPHSLQRGVRVIEFQTPTYERFIIAASQKVVTQAHWDSEQAIARMSLESVADNKTETLADGVEKVAVFSDFEVLRITVTEDRPYIFPTNMAYAFVVVMSQSINVAGLPLNNEEVCYLPGYAQQPAITSNSTATCLVTLPKGYLS